MEDHLLHPNHPKYEPHKWNKKFILNSHNCYAYAMNTVRNNWINKCKKFTKLKKTQKNRRLKTLKKKFDNVWDNWDMTGRENKDLCPYIRPQLGVYSKTIKKHYANFKSITKKNIEKMLLKDNPMIKKIKKGGECDWGYYKICLIVWTHSPKEWGDFHFLRQDNTGLWSHKDGCAPAQNKIGGAFIKDPVVYIKKRNKKKKSKMEMCGYYAVPINGRKNLQSLVDMK